MHMNDVGPDGHMHRHRDAESCSGGEDTRLAMREVSCVPIDMVADGFAKPFMVARPSNNRFVQDAPGFFRHAESSLVDLCVDLFRGMAHQRQLEIVNDPGAVHRYCGDDAMLHPIDDDWVEPHLYDVRADPNDHRPTLSVRISDSLGDGPQGLNNENI